VLLHADGEQAVPYAQAAYVAASLINKSAEELVEGVPGALVLDRLRAKLSLSDEERAELDLRR